MMGIKTKIEWADSSINPIMGCTGCALRENHCYAAILCTRYARRKGWPKSFDQPEFFPGRLEKAIRWPDLSGTERPDKPWLNGLPRHIFVNDLSDGFCPDVDAWGWLLPHLDAMAESSHIWLLLTKWPDRMREFFASLGGAPSNFWLGTSVLSQDDEWRIGELRQIKASVHWLSLEPLLGPVNDLAAYFGGPYCPWCGSRDLQSSQRLSDYRLSCQHCEWGSNSSVWGKRGIDWVIVGGESGPGARPMHPDWARGIRDQCVAAGVPFFFKQHGAWLHQSQTTVQQRGQMHDKLKSLLSHKWPDGSYSWRVGKKYAGRLLDGRTWDGMPALQGQRSKHVAVVVCQECGVEQ